MEEDIVAGAPLIICPSAGDQISKKMKKVLKRFKEEHKVDVKLCERGGSKIGNIAKSDPLKPPTFSREDYFPCSAEGGGVTVVGDVLPTGWSVRNVKHIKSLLFIMEKLGEMDTLVVWNI